MAADPIRIGLVGLGKISVDEHLPAIAANPDFELVGAVSPRSTVDGVRSFADLRSLIVDGSVDAVAINTPPQVRFELAREALLAGRHVLLEKPPGATASEVAELEALARAQGCTLFTAWHSQYAAGVEPARQWLADKEIQRVTVRWCENVRQWHPGQQWIWEPGGLGVFDPGINALSIVTRILPPVRLESARLDFPANCHTPIAGELDGKVSTGGQFRMEMDFLQTGLQTWSIDVETTQGRLSLAMGGAQLSIAGKSQILSDEREYSLVYRQFARLVRAGISEVDNRPLQMVADAFLIARRETVAEFYD